MLRHPRVRVGAVAVALVLAGCTAAEPDAVPSEATSEPSAAAAPAAGSTPAPTASASAEPPPAPPAAPVESAPAPAPPPPPPAAPPAAAPPAPAEELLSPEEAEQVLIDTVATELGVPRFLVSRYIAANGGLEAVARENGVSEEDIARLNEGVTRSELDAALGPVVDQIEQRLAER